MNVLDKYIIIIAIGLFILFALIGYLVEITKKSKEIEKQREEQLKYIQNMKNVSVNDLMEGNLNKTTTESQLSNIKVNDIIEPKKI